VSILLECRSTRLPEGGVMSRSRRVDVFAPVVDLHQDGGPGQAPVPPQAVKLSILVPIEVEMRLHGLARFLGVTKRELAVKFLVQGLERYQEDRRLRRVAAELVGPDDAAA
jgi:hypothetical protein